ncbi:MAG: L-2-amino-thiazoline-4-carboxylic acid hydrolase [Zymomonas mobilis]|uniref:L-2-amino-thiazoline-4-carboxylic acid hydrolase-like protein n=1 Tax=Zymomonas mobilis TaxID=542 RepID=A0A542VZR1_ZYMMB|nr:L-2-amino-thiazoline-4-carboxylic acid hydrolase [Zymomonas mobilis]TQL16822.1 L-2-amino-thiazoline-4-carboxylic acid hydrolase-like protein [Zymomonas mobilis]
MTAKSGTEMGILKRRRIEAEIVKPIYEAMIRHFGKEKAQAVLKEAITADAVRAGKEMAAKQEGGATLENFAAMQYLWEQDDALKVDILASDDQHLDYNVTRCRYAEMYREMGLGEIGSILSCTRDESFIQGYNSDIEMSRSQTIMKGADFCNFRYRLKEKQKENL